MSKMHTPQNQATLYESIPNVEGGTKHDRVNRPLGLYDVICGRHKAAFDNIGNRRFRVLVALVHEKYANAPTRAHKSIVIKDIVDSVHSGGGRFLQRLGCHWVELDEKQRHDKVGHALRDMAVASKAKSSNKKSNQSSIDHSDRSNATESIASGTPTLKLHPSRAEEFRNGASNGYFVSFPTNIHAANLESNTGSTEFIFDENDTSLEPIAWPTPTSHQQQFHRHSDATIDEYVIMKLFALDDNDQPRVYSL